MEPSLFTTEWIATCFRNFVSESFKNHIPIKWEINFQYIEYTVVQRYMDLLPVLGLFLHYSISDWSCLAHFLTVVKCIFHAGMLVYVLTTLWKGVQTSLSIIHLQFLRGKSCKAKPNLSLQTWQRLLWHKSCYCLSWFVAYFINVNPILLLYYNGNTAVTVNDYYKYINYSLYHWIFMWGGMHFRSQKGKISLSPSQ